MKKTIAFVLLFALCFSAALIAVSAEEEIEILPASAEAWGSMSAGDEDAQVKIENGATVVWGSTASWPAAYYDMAEEDYITVSVENTSILYDFTVDTGACNISFFFKGSIPSNFIDGNHYSIINGIESSGKDPGSGDILAGTYKGSIKISDLVSQADFEQEALNGDGTITISGMKVFTVGGASITINKLVLVDNSDVPATSEPVSETSVPGESSVPVSDASGSNDNDISGTSSNPQSGADSNVNSDSEEKEGSSTTVYIIIGAVVVVVAAAAYFLLKKKK